MPEGLKVTVLIEVCSREFSDYIELSNKDFHRNSALEELMNFVERKRWTAMSQVKAMKVDEVHSTFSKEEHYGY